MKILTGEEKKTIYPELFKKIFGFEPNHQIPRVVITDDKMRGFISGYLLDKITFYTSWVGHLDGFKSVRKAWVGVEEELRQSGVQYLVGRIVNKNTTMQRLIMGLGWIPRGMIVADAIYIEYYKEL
jgi:hypothetical protein